MDLGAYAQIENLEEIVRKNKIVCPRLRGYRLMSKEKPIELTKEDIQLISYDCAEDLCTSIPFWNANGYSHEYSSYTRSLLKKYLDEETNEIKWNKIHGWKRKVLKTFIHNKVKLFKNQYDVFNKYAGRPDVLYIHARIGGYNWLCYKKEVINQPWFIEKIDDAYDSTYCDIYAKINY